MPSLKRGPTSRRGSQGQLAMSQVALTSSSARDMASSPTLHMQPHANPAEPLADFVSPESTLSRVRHRKQIRDSASSCMHGVENTLKSSNGYANASLLLWLLIATAISVPVVLVLTRHTNALVRQPLDSDCQSTVAGMTSLLQIPVGEIYSYQWLFQSGVNVTQSAFQKYESSHMAQSRLVPWVGYAPYVTSAQRAEWEAENQHAIVQNKAMGGSQPFWPSGSFIPDVRSAADSYFPTLLVPGMTDWLIGFDVLSDPAAQLVAFDAIHTGQLSVGPKMDVDLVTGTDRVHRFVLPYYGQNRSTNVEGIIHGSTTPQRKTLVWEFKSWTPARAIV
ncbi:hypothetical protein BDZ88DRAFT_137748 [Geranomyces variabilis]|nr:hypothetical protein BDZ88DRAFT_137748 [Geranomyces variabilis]